MSVWRTICSSLLFLIVHQFGDFSILISLESVLFSGLKRTSSDVFELVFCCSVASVVSNISISSSSVFFGIFFATVLSISFMPSWVAAESFIG